MGGRLTMGGMRRRRRRRTAEEAALLVHEHLVQRRAKLPVVEVEARRDVREHRQEDGGLPLVVIDKVEVGRQELRARAAGSARGEGEGGAGVDGGGGA